MTDNSNKNRNVMKLIETSIDYDFLLPVPDTLNIQANGEEYSYSLTCWVDYDGYWHCGYRNWTLDCPFIPQSFVIRSSITTSSLYEALEDLKEILSLADLLPNKFKKEIIDQ